MVMRNRANGAHALLLTTLIPVSIAHAGTDWPSACNPESAPAVGDFLGLYTTVSVDRYRGGLTTRVQAYARLHETVLIDPDVFRFGDYEFSPPRYEVSCHDLTSREEGQVPTSPERLLSTFWGVGPKRRAIWVLQASNAEGTEEVHFEVAPLGTSDLWFLHDGWLFVLTRDSAG